MTNPDNMLVDPYHLDAGPYQLVVDPYLTIDFYIDPYPIFVKTLSLPSLLE